MKRILITTALGLTLAMPVVAQEIDATPLPEGTIQTQGEGALDSGTMGHESVAPQADVSGEVQANAAWDTITADELHGKSVLGPNGEAVGDVSEVILDDQMKVSEVIVDVGGFLGMGEKSVAIDPDKIALLQEGDDVTLHIASTEEELKAMPEYQG